MVLPPDGRAKQVVLPPTREEHDVNLSLSTHKNSILAAFPEAELTRLRPHLVPVPLPVRQVLHKPEGRIEFVYFPMSGIASSVAGEPESRIEVGLIGRDGMTGLSAVLGVDRSPHECFMQIAGDALRVPATELMQAFDAEPGVRKPILLYAAKFMHQIAQTALANGRHTIEERLARWLLMCQDRLDGDEIRLTHEFLSKMLGVTRPGVTIALNTLEAATVIRTHRGSITVLDRATLEEIAGAAYSRP